MVLLGFPAGVRIPRSVCGGLSVTDDRLAEGEETVAVMAAFVQSSPEINLVSNNATITIRDHNCKQNACVYACGSGEWNEH